MVEAFISCITQRNRCICYPEVRVEAQAMGGAGGKLHGDQRLSYFEVSCVAVLRKPSGDIWEPEVRPLPSSSTEKNLLQAGTVISDRNPLFAPIVYFTNVGKCQFLFTKRQYFRATPLSTEVCSFSEKQI